MEDEAIVKIWKYIIIGTVCLIVSAMGSCQMTNYRILQAIEAGADPLEATCAIASADNTSGCITIALINKGE